MQEKIVSSRSHTVRMRYGKLTLDICSYGSSDCVELYIQTACGTSHVGSMEIFPDGLTIMRPSSGSVVVSGEKDLTEHANVTRVPL